MTEESTDRSIPAAAGSHDFVVTDSELLGESPILAVRRDTLVMPGGNQATREVVEHFGAVAIAAVDERGRIAMVHQYRHSVRRRLWELPAGLLDIADEDPLLGARRELAEEAGLAASEFAVLADLVTSPGFCEEVCRVYLATGLSEVARPESDGDEEADLTFRWVDLAEARARVLSGEITNSIAVAGIFAASEVLERDGTPREPDASFDLRPTSLPRRRQRDGVVPDMKKI